MMVHERIVFRVNDQRGFRDIAQARHRAALAIVVQRIGKAVNFGGDGIVKLANAPHAFELA